MIRLLLVDDHPVVLDGLEAALASHEGMAVVARAGSVAEARAAMRGQEIDVALVDIRLPDGTGLELLPGQEQATNAPAVILLTTFQSPQYVAKAMGLGARGFLLKTAPTDEIVDALRRVAAGGIAFQVFSDAVQTYTDPLLTIRERQIVAAIAAGQTNKEIAHHLQISPKTVEWHIARLYARLGVRSRAELVAHADRGGWLESATDAEP